MEQLDKPFFSIIIPIYNTGKELPRCLNSVLNQSFKDYECIMVDDGSTDDSGLVCDQWAEQDSRFISLHKINGGCSEARNFGINKARGQYILFIDSDDYWNGTNPLQDIYNCIQNNQFPDVVCFGVTILDEDGKEQKVRLPHVPNQNLNKESLVQYLMETNEYFSTSYVKVLKSDFLMNNQLFFVKGLLSEDIEWSARILVLAKSIGIYSSAFYYRIIRKEGSITASIGEKNIKDILYSIKNGLIFTKEHAENSKMLELYYQYWAYQYAMLFGLIGNIQSMMQKEEIYQDMEQLKWLLKYDFVRKVKLVHYLVNIVGVKLSIKILSKYYQMRRA